MTLNDIGQIKLQFTFIVFITLPLWCVQVIAQGGTGNMELDDDDVKDLDDPRLMNLGKIFFSKSPWAKISSANLASGLLDE